MTDAPFSENKAFAVTPPGEAYATHHDMMQAFEAFKAVNDERLGELERKLSVDVVTAEKLERISADLDRQQRRMSEMTLKAARPRLDGASGRPLTEHKQAFEAYVRRGDARGLTRFEAKALSLADGPDGGYTVPIEIDSEIGIRLARLSPIRALATVRQINTLTYRKPYSTTGFSVGWVADTDAQPQTSTSQLAALDFPAMELYAMPAATPTLLEDTASDIETWIADELELTFAEQEGQAFVGGNGTSRPKGFLSYPQVADAGWSWGNIGTVATATAGGFAATSPSDTLVDLVYALRAGYRQNATFVMNRRTQAQIRKFKDSQGHYLWQPPAQPGGQASLMNFPVADAEDMPDIADGATPIAFGDFRRGYLVVDRVGTRVLRDPYSAKPYILFYTTKRVGGGIQDFAAIKLLKTAVA